MGDLGLKRRPSYEAGPREVGVMSLKEGQKLEYLKISFNRFWLNYETW